MLAGKRKRDQYDFFGSVSREGDGHEDLGVGIVMKKKGLMTKAEISLGVHWV